MDIKGSKCLQKGDFKKILGKGTSIAQKKRKVEKSEQSTCLGSGEVRENQNFYPGLNQLRKNGPATSRR